MYWGYKMKNNSLSLLIPNHPVSHWKELVSTISSAFFHCTLNIYIYINVCKYIYIHFYTKNYIPDVLSCFFLLNN